MMEQTVMIAMAIGGVFLFIFGRKTGQNSEKAKQTKRRDAAVKRRNEARKEVQVDTDAGLIDRLAGKRD